MKTDNKMRGLVLTPEQQKSRRQRNVAIALAIEWAAIALSYTTDYPVGFFVGTLGAAAYTLGRAWAGWRRRTGAPRQSVRRRFGDAPR